MSKLQIEQLHTDFGASIRGVDLSSDIAGGVLEEIHEAIDTYSFLCFPDQSMSDEHLLAFTRLLGEPEPEHVTLGQTGKTVYFGTVGNVGDGGVQKGNAHPNTHYQTGNQLWHADSSFREQPCSLTITHAHEVPGEGGATQFVSSRAAFERLPDDLRGRVEPLKVIHDYVFSRSQVAPVDPNHAASLPPVAHKLIKENPRNGRKNYYVGSHVRSVVGWPGIESRELIDDLMARTTRSEDIYDHQWQAGDTVILDNRCLLHRGTPYDADRWRRRMRQTRVAGSEFGQLHS
ncbi:MAG: TauD/TfdA dioxygenase family protein [Aestuariivirgaceae bacterium]